ncbi:MAG: hypothetical protein IAE92_05675 [Burkholderiaceae bacterium]|nr:hypothetical protein [Burkholderiaceae bacterium]
MKIFVMILMVCSLLATPAPALARPLLQDDFIEKTYCAYAYGYTDAAAMKTELLTNAKRQAVNQIFGELISGSTAVENFVVTRDQIQASSLGYVRIAGDPEYFNGVNLGEVCVKVRAYVTPEDLAKFTPELLTKRFCFSNQDLTADKLASFVKEEAAVQALVDYNGSLAGVKRERLLGLLQKVTYLESGFLPETTTYCAKLEGYVTPVEVAALISFGDDPPPPPTPQPKNDGGTEPEEASDGATAGELLGEPVMVTVVESEHPYANDSDESWFIGNDSPENAFQLHFKRIELEAGVDRLLITDADGRVMQEIDASYPDGLWTDPIPGVGAYVQLLTDGADTAWGFAVDKVAAFDYPTLGYSPHPYPNDSAEFLVLLNDDPAATGTQVVFDRIELEDGVDYLVIMDAEDTPYQWITGGHPEGLTSAAVPGVAVKVQLVSDGSVRAWGYNIRELASGEPGEPEDRPTTPSALAESAHPYVNDFEKVWTLTNPDVTAASTKVHFDRLALSRGDVVELLDASGTVLQAFQEVSGNDFWSDYLPGRVVKVRLATRSGYEDWGFRIDKLATAVERPGLAQSPHPYYNDTNDTWTITNPDPKAMSSKIHISFLEIARGDILDLLDASGTLIQRFEEGYAEDIWSDYAPGRVIKVRFTTRGGYEGWGFRIDAIATSVDNPGLVQSDHPYTDGIDQVWTISNPDANAQSSRVHFQWLWLARGDYVELLDSSGNVVQTFNEMRGEDIWSDYIPGRVVKVHFVTRNGYEDWGFRIDAIESK